MSSKIYHDVIVGRTFVLRSMKCIRLFEMDVHHNIVVLFFSGVQSSAVHLQCDTCRLSGWNDDLSNEITHTEIRQEINAFTKQHSQALALQHVSNLFEIENVINSSDNENHPFAVELENKHDFEQMPDDLCSATARDVQKDVDGTVPISRLGDCTENLCFNCYNEIHFMDTLVDDFEKVSSHWFPKVCITIKEVFFRLIMY